MQPANVVEEREGSTWVGGVKMLPEAFCPSQEEGLLRSLVRLILKSYFNAQGQQTCPLFYPPGFR